MNSLISDYGLIGNTRTAALISKEGSIDWCCFPRFDSASVFGRILDENAGHMQIRPVGKFSSYQQYLPMTNVLETIFVTEKGKVRILDCFTIDTEKNKKKKLHPLHEILRVVEGIEGRVEMMFSFNPRPYFGKGKYKTRHAGKLGIRCDYESQILLLNHDLETKGPFFELEKGEKRIFSIIHSLTAPAVFPDLGKSALDRLECSIRFWENWSSQCNYKGEFRDDVIRSVLTLKLLTFSPSGAIIAAPTTSLPEEIGGVRNWDYRYCWLRDATFVVRSFLSLGYIAETQAYMEWILHSTALTRPRLEVFYSLFGHAKVPEKNLDWLTGYKNSKPVHVGNAADAQFQLDVYGEVMHAILLYAPFIKKFDNDKLKFIINIADSICDLWDLPDEGIWEIRSGRLHHVHSKMMAISALENFTKLSQKMKWKIQIKKYESIALKIKQQVEEFGFNKDLKSYTRAYMDDELDAAILTIPIFGNHWDQGHVKSSLETIKKNLMRDDIVFRYVHKQDGVKGGEGGFLACSFWLVEAMAKTGDKTEARDLMANILKRKNHLGLWGEEIDPETNMFLGNYPQAFSHTAFISAALSLREHV